MLLSGARIAQEVEAGRLIVEPFQRDQLNPNSYDLTLADCLVSYRAQAWRGRYVLDMRRPHPTVEHRILQDGYLLEPQKLYLGRSVEWTSSPYYVPMLEGRSSIGRLGLSVHTTAGFGDRGFRGHWTLELSVVQPLVIYPGVRIAQLCFWEVDQGGPVYEGKYLNERNTPPLPSKLWREFEPRAALAAARVRVQEELVDSSAGGEKGPSGDKAPNTQLAGS